MFLGPSVYSVNYIQVGLLAIMQLTEAWVVFNIQEVVVSKRALCTIPNELYPPIRKKKKNAR